jgi:nucleoside-diphosphate-sugar epimerase
MRLLVLGGSWFLGAQIARDALAAGWQVTTFRRGRTGVDMPGVATIRGDRTSAVDLAELAHAGPWDAVVDTSGYVPADVGRVARALAPTAARYVFLSTVSVYRDWPAGPVDEDSARRDCAADQESETGSAGDPGPVAYGAFKAGAERAVVDAFGTDRSVLLRPGVIVGPGEYVGRLPWWLYRIQRGGLVLAPGSPAATIQPVDVRDVSAFAVHSLTGHAGAYNIAGPDTSFGDFLAACRQVTGSDAVFEWVTDEAWLADHVSPWVEMLFWHNRSGAWSVDSGRARREDLVTRPLATTAADVWAWLNGGGRPVDHPRAGLVGLAAEKEGAVLAAWTALRRAETAG